ncbi:MAG: hypothetical protein JWM10_2988 [Myxococcaceae bacterium]|nr:hypothetical protein [Myxococcaceae bacterium]
MNPRRRSVLAAAALSCACLSRNPDASRDASTRTVRPERPPLPALPADEPDGHACFPADFETTRARVRGGHLELCGLTGGAPRCYSVDPVTTFVRVIDVPDAPRERALQPALEAPLTRSEVASRGARADTRGGTLSVVSASGPFRTIDPRSLGLSSLANGVLAPWGDGWFIAVFGVRAPDLGASAIIDTGKIKLRGRAAYDPCPAGS